jgi:hypothetical protein
VAIAADGIAGALFDPDWHHQLPHYLVDNWLGAVRRRYLVADKAKRLMLRAHLLPVAAEK